MTGAELDEDARIELRTLPKDLATRVARHLVMAGRLMDEDAELSLEHARAARRLASRVGIVREAYGLAAYHAGEWADALAELRAARRLAGSDDAYMPILADCERGLGRPERAIDIARSDQARRLHTEDRVELRIVEAGARRDLGQLDAAVVTLQIPELKDRRLRPWSARLFYAYADALIAAGREDESREWFAKAAAADRDGETDAAERYARLEGLAIIETGDDELLVAQATGAVEAGAEAVADDDEPSAVRPVAPPDSGDAPDTADSSDSSGPVARGAVAGSQAAASEVLFLAPEQPAEPPAPHDLHGDTDDDTDGDAGDAGEADGGIGMDGDMAAPAVAESPGSGEEDPGVREGAEERAGGADPPAEGGEGWAPGGERD